MKRPQLQLIEGSGWELSPWIDLPPTIAAKSPFDPSAACCHRVSGHDVRRAAENGRRQPAFEFWSVICGQAPPVNNVFSAAGRVEAEAGLISLSEAHACFKGIKRPLGEDDDGADYVVYVLRPRFFYRYVPSMVCVAEKVEVPGDLLFTAYARLDHPPDGGATLLIGTLTHWDFVEADANDPRLPVSFGNRYSERLW
ncbi:hypothetical protein [Hyphomicrobium sp. CS1BSMeth3]|uniref:hypothetical protein n=1 Tax=Hyphomicrobium sp. CS1BSMeth3 TaxID=1892844 RepID=UPI0011605AC5|nr:hypothetical protein [Hyphomicrobium sp. CS1BSMeth3]